MSLSGLIKTKKLPVGKGEIVDGDMLNAYILASGGKSAIKIFLTFTDEKYYYKLNNASKIKSPTCVDGKYIQKAEMLPQIPFSFKNDVELAQAHVFVRLTDVNGKQAYLLFKNENIDRANSFVRIFNKG